MLVSISLYVLVFYDEGYSPFFLTSLFGIFLYIPYDEFEKRGLS